MKALIQTAFLEWSFQVYLGFVTLGLVYVTFFNPFISPDFGAQPNPGQIFGKILVGLVIGLIVMLYVSFMLFRLRHTFGDNPSGSVLSLFWGFIAHTIKCILALLPLVIAVGVAVGVIMSGSMVDGDNRPSMADPFKMSLYMMPVLFVLSMWMTAGYAQVLAQLHAKYSLRGSFKVLVKRIKPLGVFALIYAVFTLLPHLIPGGPDMSVMSGVTDPEEMQALLESMYDNVSPVYYVATILLGSVFYIAGPLVELYVAKSLIGTDMVRKRTAKETMA